MSKANSTKEILLEQRKWCQEMMANCEPSKFMKMQFAANIWGLNRMLDAIDITTRIRDKVRERIK